MDEALTVKGRTVETCFQSNRNARQTLTACYRLLLGDDNSPSPQEGSVQDSRRNVTPPRQTQEAEA